MPRLHLSTLLVTSVAIGTVLSLNLYDSSGCAVCGWPFEAYFPANSDLYGQWPPGVALWDAILGIGIVGVVTCTAEARARGCAVDGLALDLVIIRIHLFRLSLAAGVCGYFFAAIWQRAWICSVEPRVFLEMWLCCLLAGSLCVKVVE